MDKKRKLRVLLSASACEPLRGSEPGLGWNWAYELALAGHEVWVLTSSEHRSGIEAFLSDKQLQNLHFAYVNVPRSFFLGRYRCHLAAVAWQYYALRAAKELDAKINFDVVHHVSFTSLHVGSQLWRLGKPFVFGPVGGAQLAPRGFWRYLRGGRIAEGIRNLVVRHFTGVLFAAKSTVMHSKLVLVANGETRDLVENLGGARVECMLDCGIPTSMLLNSARRHPTKSDHLRILWVGRLMPRKGILLALEALSQVDSSVKFTFTILGDGPQARYLPGWIERLGLSGRVIWRGQVSWPEVMDSYSHHDVFLFTSLRDTCGSQLVEAMARGAAIVTLDHHGARVAVPADAGIKVPISTRRETVKSVAQALERFARKPELIVAAGSKALEAARQLAWERKVLAMVQLYFSVIEANERQVMHHQPWVSGKRQRLKAT